MLRFIDDLAGAVLDIFKYISYFIAGFILVALPLIVIAKIFELIL